MVWLSHSQSNSGSLRRKMSNDRPFSRFSFVYGRTDRTKLFALSFVCFVSMMLVLHQYRLPASDAVGLGLDTIWSYTNPHMHVYRFVAVTDLDQLSKVKKSKTPTWRSYLKFGTLKGDRNSMTVSWDEEVELTTHIAEAGRGLELSELVIWQNKLYTFDDRSGIVFEIAKQQHNYQCIPRYILTEGDGNQMKGQKTEWATVKDGSLYVGSFGKEYTQDGRVTNKWNLWIKVIEPNGNIQHVNWEKNYELLREATGTSFPGYMVHEAVHWEPYTRQWFVLPRRVSTDPYDEKLDEKKGSNLLLVIDEHWTTVKQIRVGPLVPERGWSSFKFLPGTKNSVIVALKTAEDEDKATGFATQESYITAFDLEGKELLPQTKIPGDHKYEGLEFI